LRVPQSITRGNVLSLVALAGLAVPLVALAGAGLFSRYAADDYCTAGQIQMAGFLDAQSRLYVGWSGRFAATFLITLLELIGPTVVPFLPGLALLAWLAAAALATREVLETLGWQLPVVSVVLMAAVVVFATLSTTADLPQVLYWQTGLVTYLSPLVIGTLHVAWVTHIASARAYGIPWPLALGASFALAFAAGGTSETFAAAQVTALVLAVAIAWLAGLLASGLVILAGMLPAFYALGSNPPGRAQVIPQFVLVCGVAILSWISGTMIGGRLRSKMSDSRFGWAAAGVLVVVLALGPLFSATQVFAEVSTARAYAAAWDQVDREVRADRSQGVLDVTVEPLPSTGTVQNLQFVGADRSDWFNDCVARYYRVSSIAVPASAGLP
jgi:hypothetical protein